MAPRSQKGAPNMKSHAQAGYSLAEMLTVVAIVGILGLVTVPAFMNFRNSAKMRTTVSAFTTDLRSARQRAITQAHQVAVTYDLTATGAAPVNYKRRYNIYEGNLPFNSTAWTPVAPRAGLSTGATHELDDIVYFPANAVGTPQTFDDTLVCTGSGCTSGSDARPEVIFFPDGRVRIPSGATVGTISVKTDVNIPKKQYTIDLTPSGNIKATAQ